MKQTLLTLAAIAALGSAVFFAGCETVDVEKDIAKPLERGITGKGTVQEFDRDLPSDQPGRE